MKKLLFPRSNGVRVAPVVGWLVRRADAARAHGDWLKAARDYDAAVRRAPSLWHIKIQLGHALKELGRLEEAVAAYKDALGHPPAQAEALVHLGHAAKERGDPDAAAEYYLLAIEADPYDGRPLTEIHSIAQNITMSEARIATLRRILAKAGSSWTDKPLRQQELLPKSIVFDITDLIGFFNRHRLPTGIQRVQIELIRHALALNTSTGIACFLAKRGVWVEIEPDEFSQLLNLAEKSSDALNSEWLRTVTMFHLILASRSALLFSEGCTLIGTSPSWSNRQYFSFVDTIKRGRNVTYIPLIYDLIPVLHPEFFRAEIGAGFKWWISATLRAADHFISISKHTALDLIKVAPTLGREVKSSDVSVMPLDAEFTIRKHAALAPPPAHPYVLMVGTIEPRKNHAGAFAAWRLLAADIGWDNMPALICVGGRGWLNKEAYAMLSSDQKLRDSVEILHDVTDGQLAELYRNCLCTLYPSFYEGWGLPVTESLCYGKIPVASNAGSLPEAGVDLAIYCDPHSSASIAEALRRPIVDEAFRAQREAEICRKFKPKRWEDIALTIQRIAELQRAHHDQI